AGPPSCHRLRAAHLHHRPRAVPGCDPAPREHLGRLLVLHPPGAAHHHARIPLRDPLHGVLPPPPVLLLRHPRRHARPPPHRAPPLPPRPRAVPGSDPAPREHLGRLLVLHPPGAAHHHARIRLRDHLNGVLPLPAVLVLSHPRVDDRPRPVRVHPLRQQLGHPTLVLDHLERRHLHRRSGVLHSRRLLPAAAGRSSQRHQHHGQHDTTQHHHSSQLGGSACQHSTTPDHAASPKPMMADPGHPRLPEGPLLPAAP